MKTGAPEKTTSLKKLPMAEREKEKYLGVSFLLPSNLLPVSRSDLSANPGAGAGKDGGIQLRENYPRIWLTLSCKHEMCVTVISQSCEGCIKAKVE